MTNRILTYAGERINKNWLDWIGKLFTAHAKTDKANTLTDKEVEHLELLRKIREDLKFHKPYSRTEISIQDYISRVW